MAVADSIATKGHSTSKRKITGIFQKQRQHLQVVKNSTASDRIQKLQRLEKYILQNRESIREALRNDFRKPPAETDLSEIYAVLIEIRHAVKHLRSWMKVRYKSRVLALLTTRPSVVYEPKGAVLIISPWNFPFNLTVGPLVSAIAAGNCAILKPSEYTPHTSELMQQMIGELFDPEEVSLFQGDKDTASQLLDLPFDHIFFTGSPQVGKIVMKKAAEHLSSVTLELGGKSPVYVDRSAKIEDAAEKIVYGKFMNAGQTCIAPDYLLVDESRHGVLVESMIQQIEKYYGPDAKSRQQSASYARIINRDHFERLKQLLDQAITDGAHAETGFMNDAAEEYMAPTLLTNVSRNSALMREEIFGPILPIFPVESPEDACTFIRQYEKPLALYIFSRNTEHTNYLLQHTSAGGTCINDTLLHFLHPSLPFGGVNHSGFGKSHGFSGFKAFSNERAVLKHNTGFSALKWLYPPYTKTKQKLIDYLLKHI